MVKGLGMAHTSHTDEWSGGTITPLRLPVIAPPMVLHTTHWCQKIGRASFNLFSKPYTLEWVMPTIAQKFTPQGETFCLVVTGQDHIWEVTFSYSLLSLWLKPYLEALELTAFEPPYQLILMEVALAELLTQFENRMGYPLILSLKQGDIPHDRTETFVCTPVDGQQFPLIVGATTKAQTVLMDLLSTLTKPTARCHALLRLSVLAGIAHLGCEDLERLKVGAIIHITTPHNPLEKMKGLLENGLICDLETMAGSPTLQMTSPFTPYTHRKGFGMESDNTLQSTLETLKVPVYFEINHLDVPVESLAHLQRGHVFNMNKPVSEGIDILVNGRVVGKGEVVQIGQNYGVLVQEVY
jgi:type III secretion protein Q